MTTIAQVGYTGSISDRLRLDVAVKWCIQHGFAAVLPVKHDKLDIEDGRDFLAETKTYNIVILHFLFRGGFGWGPAKWNQHPGTKISPLHSWQAWRKRLAQTGADLIFPFGGYGEVSGAFLCTLDGYCVYRDQEDEQLWVCVKESLSQPTGMLTPKEIIATAIS